MIHLQYDCPEDIVSMPETQNGFYCDSCKKEIWDFRGMSPAQIRKIKDEKGLSCGILDSDVIEDDTRHSVMNIFKIAFVAVFLLGFNSSMLFGQTKVHYPDPEPAAEVVTQRAVITGTIYDYKKQPIQATINYYVGSDLIVIETNENGEYRFEVPAEMIGKYFYFDVQAEGMSALYKDINELESKLYVFNIYLDKYKKPRTPHRKGRMVMGKF
ncbi:MAG: hypothetical protein HUJ25_14720 [Crocinitomicaceae bacterium]|nr:hypothetical protein [Crocinitomicaceae bacterium]